MTRASDLTTISSFTSKRKENQKRANPYPWYFHKILLFLIPPKELLGDWYRAKRTRKAMLSNKRPIIATNNLTHFCHDQNSRGVSLALLFSPWGLVRIQLVTFLFLVHHPFHFVWIHPGEGLHTRPYSRLEFMTKKSTNPICPRKRKSNLKPHLKVLKNK